MVERMASEWTIDRAASCDAAEILQVAQASFVSAYNLQLGIPEYNLRQLVDDPEYTSSNLVRWRNIAAGLPDANLLVARASNKVVGYAEIAPVRSIGDVPRRVLLSGLYVLPDWQRKRIGSALLQRALKAYPDECVYLFATEGTQAEAVFYPSRGFSPTGRNARTMPEDPSFMPKRPIQYGFSLPQVEMVRAAQTARTLM